MTKPTSAQPRFEAVRIEVEYRRPGERWQRAICRSKRALAKLLEREQARGSEIRIKHAEVV